VQFKNVLDHSLTKLVQGLLVPMFCFSLECIDAHWAIKHPLLSRFNHKLVLTTDNSSKSNLIFLTAMTKGVPDNMRFWSQLVLRCIC
jgi:hypothetical protein